MAEHFPAFRHCFKGYPAQCNRRAVESQTVVTKIMSLIIHSCFPPDKAHPELFRAPLLKRNACVSMVENKLRLCLVPLQVAPLFCWAEHREHLCDELIRVLAIKNRYCSHRNSRVHKTATKKNKEKDRQRQIRQGDGTESKVQDGARWRVRTRMKIPTGEVS